MDGMPTFWLNGHTNVLGRLLHKYFRILPTYPLCGWEWGENPFLRRFMVGKSTFVFPIFRTIELFQWKILPSQLSLVILTCLLGVLTLVGTSLIVKFIFLKDLCLHSPRCASLPPLQIQGLGLYPPLAFFFFSKIFLYGLIQILKSNPFLSVQFHLEIQTPFKG